MTMMGLRAGVHLIRACLRFGTPSRPADVRSGPAWSREICSHHWAVFSGTVELTPPMPKIGAIAPIPPTPYYENLLFSVLCGTRVVCARAPPLAAAEAGHALVPPRRAPRAGPSQEHVRAGPPALFESHTKHLGVLWGPTHSSAVVNETPKAHVVPRAAPKPRARTHGDSSRQASAGPLCHLNLHPRNMLLDKGPLRPALWQLPLLTPGHSIAAVGALKSSLSATAGGKGGLIFVEHDFRRRRAQDLGLRVPRAANHAQAAAQARGPHPSALPRAMLPR